MAVKAIATAVRIIEFLPVYPFTRLPVYPSLWIPFHRILHDVRYTIDHPLWCRSALEVVIEELEVPDGQVTTVGEAAQTVAFTRIRQHHRLLSVEPKRVVEVHPLAERHRRIGRAVHDQKWRHGVRRVGQRAFVAIQLGIIPRRLPPATLAEEVVVVSVHTAAASHLVRPSP